MGVGLPGNYSFEIHKTVWHIRRDGVKTVALQMPEGLMMYGCAISDIIERYVASVPLLLSQRLWSSQYLAGLQELYRFYWQM